ncbi:mutator type transposase [Tanacetum coccineum]
MMMVVISVDKNAVSGDENVGGGNEIARCGDENVRSGDENDASGDDNAGSGDENDASSDDNATSGDENDASGDKNDNMEGMEDIVDDEHIIDQIDVNMEGFRFTTNSDDERHTVGDSLRPQLNINEDGLEVTNYDEFESDLDEGDIGSTRRAALRKLRKQGIVPSMDDGTMESSIGKRSDKAKKGKNVISEVVDDK